jgi:hypothetical protein
MSVRCAGAAGFVAKAVYLPAACHSCTCLACRRLPRSRTLCVPCAVHRCTMTGVRDGFMLGLRHACSLVQHRHVPSERAGDLSASNLCALTPSLYAVYLVDRCATLELAR